MESGERVTLKQLSDELGISYEATRRSFWRKVKSGKMDGHYEKVGQTIQLDVVGADLIRSGRRPVVITQDGAAEAVTELRAEIESLRAKLAEAANERAEVYKQLASERAKYSELLEEKTALLERNHELETKLLTGSEPDETQPAQPEEQPTADEPVKRSGWFRRLFGL